MTIRIGFIGLGVMGQPMALRVIGAGYPLTVYNRTASRAEPLVAAGATVANSPADVARASDIIITMVSDSADVEQVIFGPNGIAQGAAPGSVVVDMSTISPRVTRELAARLAGQGVEMLDAPVSGGEAGARAGTLSIMVGGAPETFERCRPVLETMGQRITYMGAIGAGQTTKLCNQIVGMVNLLAACEGLLFAARNGLDLAKVIEAISGGAAGSWQWSNTGQLIVQRNFDPGFRISLAQKDLRLALENAAELQLPLPATSLVNLLFRSVEAHQRGEDGVQALILALEDLAGVVLERPGDTS